jgi:KaiC/GvpD/RAD55 family RecA-like ATPase
MDMTEFDRKVEEASARINRSVANIAETLEKETSDLVGYLNNEVVPAVRTHSSKALRVAAEKLSQFAEYLDSQQKKNS